MDLYYSATASNVTTLWRAKPGILNNVLYIQWSGNFRTNIENSVGQTLRGSRVGAVGRVYYFGSGNSSSWTFKRYTNAGVKSDLETAGNVSPKSIRVAIGPDGSQRVAWYNESSKKIHYLKPIAANVDIPIPAGQPVALSGNLTNPDLLGLHFGPDGTPYILYRTTNAAAFIAFPDDNFDFNGNGRPDLLDTAFNSTTAGLETMPVGPAAAGVPNSANRFKIRFPTIGSAFSNGAGAVQSSAENLRYGVELSTDMGVWTPLASGLNINYTATSTNGALKTFVGVINDPAPGSLSHRFARLTVTRLSYPY